MVALNLSCVYILRVLYTSSISHDLLDDDDDDDDGVSRDDETRREEAPPPPPTATFPKEGGCAADADGDGDDEVRAAAGS